MRKQPLRASVVIPAYNAATRLRACLEALQKQTVQPKEIMVVDDGSTDDPSSIVNEFKKVQLIGQKNQGPAKARNVGAKAVKGEIVVFLDSDCVPEKNWLEEMLKPLNENKEVVGVQGAYKTHQKSWVAQFDQLDIEYRYERMKKSKKLDWIGSYSAAYKRDVFLENGGFDESFPKASGEDSEFSYRLAEKGLLLVFNPQAIVYHTHPATVKKYMETKFNRGYWRLRMYVKHPQKMLTDSYTSTFIKLNFFLGVALVAILSTLMASLLFVGFVPIVDLVLLWYASTLILLLLVLVFSRFLLFVYRRDPLLVPSAVFLLFVRTLAYVFGVAVGTLDRRVTA